MPTRNALPSIPAQVSETATGTSTSQMVNAGNDSKTSLNGNGSLKADVWEGNTSGGLGWNDNNGHANYLPYSGSFYDPDVALVEGVGINQSPFVTWYAVVVYTNSSSDVVCDIYEWDLANFTFMTWSPTSTILQTAGYYTTVNVDADISGNS